MSAHAYTPPRLPASRAREIRRRLLQLHLELADIRHLLEGYDQGGGDDACDLAAKDLATCLPELKSAAEWLALLS